MLIPRLACSGAFPIHRMIMTKSITLLIAFTALVVAGEEAFAQCSTTPCATPMPASSAADACILPGPQSLNCYIGSTGPTVNPGPWPLLCNQTGSPMQNPDWFAFTADAPQVGFTVTNLGCPGGWLLLQSAIISTSDCVNFTPISTCFGGIAPGTTEGVLSFPLTPGNTYYLLVQGYGGAECNYVINATFPNVLGDLVFCGPGSQATYTSPVAADWEISPPGAGNFIGPFMNTTQVMVDWLQQGAVQLCASDPNCPLPPVCKDITVGQDVTVSEDVNLCPNSTVECAGQQFSTPGTHPVILDNNGCDSTVNCIVHLLPVIPPTTEHVDICQGNTTSCAGQTFSAPGTYPVHFTSYQNCDSLVNCVVHLLPVIPATTQDVALCQNKTVNCAGETFSAPGTYPVHFTAYQGCDSTVNCVVHLIPLASPETIAVERCAPASYSTCDGTFEVSGFYQYTCVGGSWQGCDSLVNLDLAIFNPVPGIAPFGPLPCTPPGQLTLYGNDSSSNPVPGGITQFQWFGPGIVGASNQMAVVVDQPGEYCLQLTQSRNGTACSNSLCVTVPDPAGSQAGLMDTIDLLLCGPKPAVPVYQGGEMLQPGDAQAFILYGDSLQPLASILAYADTLYFPFLPDTLKYDSMYFISAVAGHLQPNDSIDLDGGCLSISKPLRVRWHAPPTLTVAQMDPTVCEKDCTGESFQFSGIPPFLLIWQIVQGGQILLEGQEIETGFGKTLTICPADFNPPALGPVEFRVLNLKDKYCGCAD